MYSDEDLNLAVKKGIFTPASVDEFRHSISALKNSPTVDEENFKLIGGFNDIFVVIACCLLLFSAVFVLKPISDSLGMLAFIALSWGLSEFFVLKRKMSLPAIILLIAFVGGVFSFAISLFAEMKEVGLIIAAAASTAAAYVHWLRFKVPITVAAGTVALIGLVISIMLSVFPNAKGWLLVMLAIAGVGAFCLAMFWDSADTSRVTRKSDVAFWLHLVAAPLIIHPVFSTLGVLEQNDSLLNMAVIIVLYIIMTMISIIIDRRAFMVSSLAYVLYALTAIIKTYGDVGYSFALTGVFMGAVLLLLSAFWQTTRRKLVLFLPIKIRAYLPKVDG
ncbi:MAG: hypothetical protein ACSHW0_18895 [Thalassotalea sp.]